MQEPTMQDSGERRQFASGAARDRGEFKPRPDLISPHANRREGAWLALGAKKYKPRNWEAGMPISECVASLARHLEAYKLGMMDEDHMAAIRTNAGFILHYEEEIKASRLPLSLDDMPHYVGGGLCPDPQPINKLEVARSQVKSTQQFSVGKAVEKKVEQRLKDFDSPFQDEDEGLAVPIASHHFDPSPEHTIFACKNPEDIQALQVTGHPFTVYLCGPITGQPIDYEWRARATEFLAAEGIKTLDPLRGKAAKSIENLGLSYKGQLAAPEIASRDELDIQESDVILAHFPYDPPRQSIGSLMEMGAAAIGFKKPVILCSKIAVFNDHLFCRNFCTMEPDFDLALNRVVALSHVKKG